ncbi:MAG: hypothetical protein GX575_10600 [Candidatus Anammoximicrobium sp.]|nr:hypothetical protein [Candidatus Anammoximicrobium sp.]
MYRRVIFVTALAWLSVCCPAVAPAAVVEGRVYLDTNGNRQADAGEPGVERVLVSDGRRVAATDAAGQYRLETADSASLVWVSVPRDHAVCGSFWRAVGGAGRADFGLVSRPQSADFTFLQITDTHIGREDLLKRFAEGVGKLPIPIAFVVNTGDLVGGVDVVPPEKAPAQFDRYLGAAAAFQQPLFNVPGNHEHVAFNVPDADKTHPLYGKGLYRKLFGPMYYSWDWGGIHFLALDGTSLPYQEKLGADQLAWLAADLQFQPLDKPLIVFCHQSLPALRDAAELEKILRDRQVLGAFCGHLHRTFTTQLAGFPVYHTGALSGAWWSGPNPDGTPQGFRLVQIQDGALKTAYTNREGAYPLYVSAPPASSVQTGATEFEVVLVDFGRPVEMSASFAGSRVPVRTAARERLWSTWKGTLDTRQAFDGDRVLKVVSQLGGQTTACEMRYLVVNGRVDPYRADAPATLKMQVRAIDAPDVILLGGEPLGVIPADTPKETTLEFKVPAKRLGKLNQVTIRAAEQGTGKDQFSVGPVWLEYLGKRIHDLRYPTFDRHTIGGNDPARGEKDLYFCLPTE